MAPYSVTKPSPVTQLWRLIEGAAPLFRDRSTLAPVPAANRDLVDIVETQFYARTIKLEYGQVRPSLVRGQGRD
jgi:hypothetical protein